MTELSSKLYKQFEQADYLETTIKKNLEFLGYGQK
jgi:type I restriction enzyme M protein